MKHSKTKSCGCVEEWNNYYNCWTLNVNTACKKHAKDLKKVSNSFSEAVKQKKADMTKDAVNSILEVLK